MGEVKERNLNEVRTERERGERKMGERERVCILND